MPPSLFLRPPESSSVNGPQHGNLVLARVVNEAKGAAGLDREDCIALDRLILEGTAMTVERPCSAVYDAYCRLADTASERSP